MIPFETLLDRPSGKEWPEVDIDYNSLQHLRNARKLPDDDLVAQWSKECWGSSYSEKDNCIEFSGSFNLFSYQAHSRKMYIFDEYRYALRNIVAAWESNAGGVVLGGHPGIGKSSLLPAVLRYFLHHERPIVYHVSGTTFLFTPKGVYEIVSHNVTFFNRLHYRGMFAFDDDDKLQPPPILVDHRSRLFVVHAASPNPDRYKSLLNY